MAGVVALLGLTGGCGAVHVAAPDASGAERRACLSLIEELPHRLSEQPRRDTDGSPLGTAWGDPPIVLRCGVGTPAGYEQFSPCQRVNGVDWFVPEEQISDQDADVLLTSIGRRPNVEVAVPSEYRPPDAVMVDLAPAIKAQTRVERRCE